MAANLNHSVNKCMLTSHNPSQTSSHSDGRITTSSLICTYRSFAINITLLLMLFISTTAAVAQTNLSRQKIDALSRTVVVITDPNGGQGSGSFMGESNLILTNRHVLERYDTFTISVLEDLYAPAVPRYQAVLHALSPTYDMAIVRVVADIDGNPLSEEAFLADARSHGYVNGSIRYVEDADIPGRGDAVGVMGYPEAGDLELIYTTGIVSSVMMTDYREQRLPLWYRHTANSGGGNSGGIAFNERGEIIGIHTHGHVDSRGVRVLGSVLAISTIKAVLEAGDVRNEWEDGVVYQYQFGPEQRGLNPDLDPLYGSQTLVAGFTPDPFSIGIVSGGNVKNSYLGSGCSGFTAEAPDLALDWSGSGDILRFVFEGQEPGDDPTLTIRTPDGKYHCNDDANASSLNPMLTFDNPVEGNYLIWVGSYGEGSYHHGSLYITELNLEPGEFTETSGSPDLVWLDYSLEPGYETLDLASGAQPTVTRQAYAGGAVDVGELGIGCPGYAMQAPDFRVRWTGDTASLRIMFEADDAGNDAVLIVNTPDGQWICNDDGHETTLNPQLDLSGYDQGVFDIWIASFWQVDYFSGKLTITEQSIQVP
jgi:S1-C subfamily serine protease